MYRKIIALAFAIMLVLGTTACGDKSLGNDSEAVNGFNDAIDMDFAKEVQRTISEFGDDEAVGMRSAGSSAETETAKYIESLMKDIGLQNVTMDETTVDGWTFNGANITFTDADGNTEKIDLGGYQTTLQAKDEECELVYVGEGTMYDYEDMDVNDKLVLLDVDQNENWWINYPAYQAKVKGAKAVIAMSIYKDEGEDRIGVQDICGPADAPALAISEKDSKALQKAIKASGGDSIKVKLNCDSKVTEDATSHNVWGEIPGKTDETIFLFGHMDGYFHSAYDDAEGAAVTMSIAKALIDSNYEPDKTIRFCIHGAEEWGVSGSEYDWSAGAYQDIETNHPDWVNGAFAIVNNDGGYTVEGETQAGTYTTSELKPFVEQSLGEIIGDSKYEWTHFNNSTGTEDFHWARIGIPSIVAGEGEGTAYDDMGYHSTYDSMEAQPLDEEGFREMILTYGKFAIDLDELNVRPMDFGNRIQEFKESMNENDIISDEDFAKAEAAAKALQAKIDAVEKSGDKEAAVELNKETQEVFKVLQDYWLGMDYIEVDECVRHELYQNNIELLDEAIKALEAGNVQEAYDEYLSGVDWAWYEMNFDQETTQYMIDQQKNNSEGTFGEGLVRTPIADTDHVVRSLGEKYDVEGADVSADIEELKTIRNTQQDYLNETYADEKVGLEEAVKLMNKYAK